MSVGTIGTKKKGIEEWPFLKWVESRERWQVDARTKDGGERKFFKTKGEAEGWRTAQLIRRENEGQGAFDESALKEFGLTVADAIKFTVQHFRRQTASKTVEEAIDALVKHKLEKGRQPDYCNDLGSRCRKLLPHFKGRKISSVTTCELDDFLGGLKNERAKVADEKDRPPLDPVTKNTVRRDIGTLWSFADDKGWADKTVMERTTVASVSPKDTETLSPERMETLLRACDEVCIPAVVIRAFCEVRDDEICKLGWDSVYLNEKIIRIGAGVASKKTGQRTVKIPDNAVTWLKSCVWTGPIVPPNFRIRFDRARVKAGFKPSFFGRKDSILQEYIAKSKVQLEDWPDNVLRHSGISYRIANGEDIATVAYESGTSVAKIKSNYLDIRLPSEAKQYLNILP